MRGTLKAIVLAASASAALALPNAPADAQNKSSAIVVTGTRLPEDPARTPDAITLISGDELRARRVSDLHGALALVAGVEASPGGDAGPASAVPSFWGLHEFDDFLLVVDGIPLGGAFDPAIPDLNLTDVERIEVLRGSAPVVYGATAFVGVIHVIHYPAGQAADQLSVSGGTHDSWRAEASIALPKMGTIQQSVALSGRRDGYDDPRQKLKNGQALYRAATPLGAGRLRFDFDYTAMRSVPGSPVEVEGTSLTNQTPFDANYNPLDARIDEYRAHGVLGYTVATSLGEWETTASVSRSRIVDIRGFLRPDLVNADSQNQRRHIDDDYGDTHVTSHLGSTARLVWGADVLYGHAAQTSRNGGYTPALDGSAPLPRTTDLHVDEINSLADKRVFTGQYVQLNWTPAARWTIDAGVRLNETHERKQSTHVDGFDPAADTFDDRTRRNMRVSGAAGVSYLAWSSGKDSVSAFANYKNVFKPTEIDFGPDNTPDILNPETGRSVEGGLKARLAGGQLEIDASLFRIDLRNIVVATTDANGDPLVENAGGNRLKGFEAEAHWQLTPILVLAGAFSYHDAQFTRYIATEGGENIDASGNQPTLSPHVLASAGIIYQPPKGLFGSATVNYVGKRFLNIANTAQARAYATADARVGYRWGSYELSLFGENLSDARPPVTTSEFGDESFYRLRGRRVFVDLTISLQTRPPVSGR
jgi:iron complex outermembrane receptor protein